MAMTNYRYGQPNGAPEAGERRPLMLGFGNNQYEASRETEMQLIEKWKSWYPGSTDAEAEAALHAMSRGELNRMAMGRHEMDDRSQAVLGNACAGDYDPLPVSQGPSDDGLRPPGGGASSGNRGWYR
jgi:hypothetical protein